MISSKIKKWIATGAFLGAIPIIVSGVNWIDRRYLHKDISDIRYLQLQQIIIEGHIKDIERLSELSLADQNYLEQQKQQLDFIKQQRAKVMGIGQE